MSLSAITKYLSRAYRKQRFLPRTDNQMALERRPDHLPAPNAVSNTPGPGPQVTIHIHLSYSPQVSLQGKATAEDAAAISHLLSRQREEFARLVEEVLDQKMRERNLGF